MSYTFPKVITPSKDLQLNRADLKKISENKNRLQKGEKAKNLFNKIIENYELSKEQKDNLKRHFSNVVKHIVENLNGFVATNETTKLELENASKQENSGLLISNICKAINLRRISKNFCLENKLYFQDALSQYNNYIKSLENAADSSKLIIEDGSWVDTILEKLKDQTSFII
jgi:hypothetical protein